MRVALALFLTLTLTTSSVAHAGWSREQRAALKEIVDLENAGSLEQAVARAEQEFARVEAPAGYRRAVARRGKAVALKLSERTEDASVRSSYLCTALTMLRTYAAELAQTEPDRTEIPAEVKKLEARAVSVNAPCAPAAAPEPAAEPADAPAGSPEQPVTLASPETVPEPPTKPVPPLARRSRGQIVGGVSLLGVAAGLGSGAAACFAGRVSEDARIAALDQRATEAGRKLTDDELEQVHAADDRYTRLSNGGKAFAVFAAVGLVAAVIVLAVPSKSAAKLRARAVGGGVRLEF